MSGFGLDAFGADAFGGSGSGQEEVLAESITTTDAITLAFAFVRELADGALLTETMTQEFVYALRERMTLATTLVPGARMTAVLAETLQLDPRLVPVLDMVLAESVTLTELLDGTPLRTVVVADGLVLTGAATGTINALALLSEAIVIADALRRVQDGIITDATELAETLEVRLVATESLVASAAFADSLKSGAVFTVLVDESVEIDAALTTTASLIAHIREGIAFSVGFSFDGEAYLGLCMNPRTRGITEYTNYDFNSLANFNGRLYGAADGGLYRLDEGADDDGTAIDAVLRTALLRIGNGKQARVDSAYLGYKSDGTVQLKVIVSDNGTRKGYFYTLTSQTATTHRNGRIKIGRGLKSAYWSFELSNVAGADFDLDVLEIHPLVLDRRLK